MVLEFENELEIIEVMEAFFVTARPRELIRNKTEINYKIEGQSIIVFESLSTLNNAGERIERNIAKTTFVKMDNIWKVYNFRSDMKWHRYKTAKKVKSLTEFVKVIEEDKERCFWGVEKVRKRI